MRTKKTFINILVNLLLQIITIIAGFIIPRLILIEFGSQYNGIVSSITQFLSFAVLLRAGVGGATRAALYKPLANNDKDEINSIMKATDLFMKKIGGILFFLILLFAVIYPFFIDEFSWYFSFSLFIVIGISSFIETFFGITYLILLQADQKLWIASIFRIISIILNTVIAFILIKCNFSIHIVKIGSALAFCFYPFAINIYVKRKYKINLKVKPNNESIKQRWDVFWHQIATYVTNSTDVTVLTIFTNMYIVSIYSVYNMVLGHLKTIIMSFTNGLESTFGNIIAKNEKNKLIENLSIVEFVINFIAILIYTCAILLIASFVGIYTSGVNDVDYSKPIFAYILLISQFFFCVRIPYQMLIQAAGFYKETKWGAMLESILNITISIFLVIKVGLVGIAIGTLISTIFRTIQLAYYVYKRIIEKSFIKFVYKMFLSISQSSIIILIVLKLRLRIPMSYIQWIGNSVIVASIAITISLLFSFIFYKKDFMNTLKKSKRVFIRNK